MSRLRQNNSQNYTSSGNVNAEFENVVRYLNAAEYGNKTISELMALCFDSTGTFDAKVQLRLDASSGIQYRSGTYTGTEEGWTTVVPVADIRGTTGVNYGSIGEPIFNSRFLYTATGAVTEIDIPHDTTSILMVYKDGLLLAEGSGADYTKDSTDGTTSTGSVTFNVALASGDNVTVFKIESGSGYDFRRTDSTTSGAQANFGFVFDSKDAIQVYKNGILQRAGGGNDYVLDDINNLIIFNSSVPTANDVSIVGTGPSDSRVVTGLMTEATYTDINGYIPYTKLVLTDNQIPTSKVNGLATTLAATPSIGISGSTPSPATRLWLDTSTNPNQLKFYDGVNYISANPASSIPTFDSNSALQYLKVDATGTALSFAAIDFSSLIPVSTKAAINGVASLDTAAKLPVAQLPAVIAYDSYFSYTPTVANVTAAPIKRVFGHSVTLTKVAMRIDAGSCTVQLTVGGVVQDSAIALSTTAEVVTVFASPIEVVGTSASKLIGYTVTNATNATNLDISIVSQIKSQ